MASTVPSTRRQRARDKVRAGETRSFAIALRMPKGWYGDEEYAGNVDAFLEYLDDVVEWIPAKGHVVLIRHSEQFWCAVPRLAGELVEWWQFSFAGHQGTVHLVFVW